MTSSRGARSGSSGERARHAAPRNPGSYFVSPRVQRYRQQPSAGGQAGLETRLCPAAGSVGAEIHRAEDARTGRMGCPGTAGRARARRSSGVADAQRRAPCPHRSCRLFEAAPAAAKGPAQRKASAPYRQVLSSACDALRTADRCLRGRVGWGFGFGGWEGRKWPRCSTGAVPTIWHNENEDAQYATPNASLSPCPSSAPTHQP